MSKIRVCVVFGGRSGEHEISVISARNVLSGLDRARYDVVPVAINREGRWLPPATARAALEAGVAPAGEGTLALQPESEAGALVALQGDSIGPVDVVFPVLHGPYGEDGTIQGLLEMAGLPYVGAGVSGSAVGMDKALMKGLWQAAGLPVLPYRAVLRSRVEAEPEAVAREMVEALGLPLFVKPANLGSSVGISRAAAEGEVVEALRHAALFDRKLVVEQSARSPREIEVGMLGNDVPEVTVPGEVVHSSAFYDYRTKYLDKEGSRTYIPADLDEAQTARVQDLARRAWQALDLNGLCRMDFLLDASGEIYLNEVNTLPGFTPISMFAKLWEATGLAFPRLLDRLVELAVERHADRRRNLSQSPVSG